MTYAEFADPNRGALDFLAMPLGFALACLAVGLVVALVLKIIG